MRAGVIVAGLLIGMLVGSGCGSDKEDGREAEEFVTPVAAPAESEPATPAPAAAKPAPVTARPAPVAAVSEPAAAPLTPESRLHREMLYKGLAETHPNATTDQLTCASDQILEQMGWTRFENLVALEMARAAGQSSEPSAEATEDRVILDSIISGCGMTSS